MAYDDRLSEYLFWRSQYVARNSIFLEMERRAQEVVDSFFSNTPENQDGYWIAALPGALEADEGREDYYYSLSEKQWAIILEGRELEKEKKRVFPFSIEPLVDHDLILHECIKGSFASFLGKQIITTQKGCIQRIGIERLDTCRDFVIPLGELGADPDTFDLRINVHGNIEQILEGVRFWYWSKKLPTSELFCEETNCIPEELKVSSAKYSRGAALKQFQKNSPNIPIKNFHTDARAVGLWLFEEVSLSGVKNVAKQIRRLKKVEGFDRLGFGESEFDVLRRLYNKTCSCISAGEVLPLS
ncbi:hypothetical protein [Desulfovibrio oxyclinae]|uniref:hypothetical protein n=1 Tax=Desulfovibrio oxyclinae TaxID=63560 RepID=UPI00037914B6|nr:hypothetical protein [Desulfovibrio oxyclinae]